MPPDLLLHQQQVLQPFSCPWRVLASGHMVAALGLAGRPGVWITLLRFPHDGVCTLQETGESIVVRIILVRWVPDGGLSWMQCSLAGRRSLSYQASAPALCAMPPT